MQTEMDQHLGYETHDPAGANGGNSRNRVTHKTLKGDFGEVEIATPRDRNGEFELQMVRKNQTCWAGFDEKILSMYAHGMSTREIQGHLEKRCTSFGRRIRKSQRRALYVKLISNCTFRTSAGKPTGRCRADPYPSLLQLDVLRLSLPENREVGVRILPERQETFIRTLRFGAVSR